ncbi:hypothetical protein BJ166DRAFT_493024 [Pestalotiopsis sp. NC0098]|nr:hypothetical protein BJ166DRAFT_493024 [Pestalotiopsis sp. NC0098]
MAASAVVRGPDASMDWYICAIDNGLKGDPQPSSDMERADTVPTCVGMEMTQKLSDEQERTNPEVKRKQEHWKSLGMQQLREPSFCVNYANRFESPGMALLQIAGYQRNALAYLVSAYGLRFLGNNAGRSVIPASDDGEEPISMLQRRQTGHDHGDHSHDASVSGTTVYQGAIICEDPEQHRSQSSCGDTGIHSTHKDVAQADRDESAALIWAATRAWNRFPRTNLANLFAKKEEAVAKFSPLLGETSFLPSAAPRAPDPPRPPPPVERRAKRPIDMVIEDSEEEDDE